MRTREVASVPAMADDMFAHFGRPPAPLYGGGFLGKSESMFVASWRRVSALCLVLPALWLHAGGSGLNVVVVVNQRSADSVELGNYFCERRQVPPQNLVRLTNWAGGNVEWTAAGFTNSLFNPLVALLSARQLTNQVDYVVLSMDFPYRVVQGGLLTSGTSSTTSALFYGFKTDDCLPCNPASCSLPSASVNRYAGSEGIFRLTSPGSAPNSFLVTMLTSSNLAQAKALIDRGVAGDGTFPTQTVYLAKSSDVFRNIRYQTFDNALFDARLRGNNSILRTNSDSPYGLTGTAGYQNGLYQFSILPDAFGAGAIADSLTSFAGRIYESNDYTTLLAFLNAGASISYGTVVEPCAYLAKFPSPQDYFYQARGFSLAECYYMSVTNPYQGLMVGEPLAAPFAQPPNTAWSNLPANSVLTGNTNLTLQLSAGAPNLPVQQVDLFLDGTWVQTLTNIPPAANNVLTATINGRPISYTVPTGATVASVTSGLVSQINQPQNLSATRVQAYTHGDRIGLQSTDITSQGDHIAIEVTNSIGTAAALTTFFSASRTDLLDTIAYGLRGFSVTNAPHAGDYLQLTVTKTNGTQVILAVTNSPATNTTSQLTQQLLDVVNTDARLHPANGLVAEDFIAYDVWFGQPYAEFNLRSRSAGWRTAQIQVALIGSPTFSLKPGGTQKLDQNVNDLQPRGHLYVMAGVTNLALTFPFNSTTRPDGYHELTAVAYEGSHVRTQRRVSQTVRIKNTSLAATLDCLVCGSNTAVEATLKFSVTANTNNIARIELFSTGGSVAAANSQSSVVLSVGGTNLGAGLHPFYALVTTTGGKQYRTDTKWIRLLRTEPPFSLQMTLPPPALFWPATAGRSYDILSADAIAEAFQVRASITPTDNAAAWTDTNAISSNRFYRVRTSR